MKVHDRVSIDADCFSDGEIIRVVHDDVYRVKLDKPPPKEFLQSNNEVLMFERNLTVIEKVK